MLPIRVLNRPLVLSLLLFSLVVSRADGQDGWKTYWKNGTRIESEDGRFAIKIGGRIQADFSFADPDAGLEPLFDFEDGSEFRRARLFVQGTLYDRFEFKAQYDFADDSAPVKDVYVGLVDLPVVGGVRVGHFKEPLGLEELTSSKYLAFLERAFAIPAPSRNMGIMLHNAVADDRITWAAGAFQDSDGYGESVGDEWNLTGRLTGLPFATDDDRSLVHLGLSYSARSPVDDVARIRTRPQAHLAPRLVDTGSIAARSLDLFGLEAAVVAGPFWAQAERVQASLSDPTDADFDGWSVQAGWFLTGESRAYKRSSGVFDRLKPKEDFLSGGGAGAWEIAVRYGSTDLSDGAVDGGEQDGFGVAVNWYPNSASRVMLNWVSTDLDGAGSVDYLLARFQVDF